MTWLEILKEVSVIIVSIIAVFGINSWRRELRVKRKMALAEEALSLFYQANDAIKDMRFPGGYGYEGKSRKSKENESENEKEARDNAYVMIERYQPYKEVFAKLQSIRYQFMALFGKQSGEVFEKLRRLHNRLFLSANRLSRLWAKKDEENYNKKDYINRIQIEEEFFWDSGEGDKINSEMQSIIKEIEDICVPVLAGKRV